MTDGHDRRTWLIVGGLAVLAFALTLLATRHGPGVSPDSVSYLASARSFAHGHGFTDFDGAPLTYWPPGFPAVLAAFEVIGVHGVDAARIVNAVFLATVVVLSFCLLRRHVSSQPFVLFGTALVAFSPALLRTGDMVWAEPLFTVLVLAFVLLLEGACRSGSYPVIAATGVVASAAILVKYFGFALTAAGVLALVATAVFDTSKLGAHARTVVAKVAWFAFWGCLGPALWGIRNLDLGEPVFGRRTPAGLGIVTIARAELEGIGRFFVPDGVPRALSVAVGLLVLAVVAVAIVVVLRDRAARGMVPLLIVLVAMFGAAFVSRVTAGSDVNARVLSPVYVPCVVTAVWLFEYLRARARDDAPRRAFEVLAVLAVVGFVGFFVWSVGLVWSHGREGRGYEAAGFTRSELIGAVARLPASARVYSNDPKAVAYVTGRQPVRLALGPGEVNQIGRRSSAEAELRRLACSRPVRVAWFGNDLAVPSSFGEADELRDGVLVTVACDR